jgi:endonuclease/exonuclease/phosphatase family metal-dependent hydrolase
MQIATWNVQWAGPRSARGPRIAATLAALDADIVVVTEAVIGLLSQPAHRIDAGDDWGYGHQPHRRKVLAWSKRPWRDVARLPDRAARRRLVMGVTDTPDGPVRVIAVCIPWRDAHVRTGRADARPWGEHLEFCHQLRELRSTLDPRERLAVVGDFNQRIPKARQPAPVAEALAGALDGLDVWSAGDTSVGPLIDHIAGDRRLAIDGIQVWPAADADGRLSDHRGVACAISPTAEPGAGAGSAR